MAKRALVLAEGVFSTTDGKAAHGLVRYCRRYEVVGVIDSRTAGWDAGEFLDGRPSGVMIYRSLDEALRSVDAQVLIVGAATVGGRLPPGYRAIVRRALELGMDVVSGLHEFLSDDPELARIAEATGAEIVDVRKMFRDLKIPFRGVISEVRSLRVAVLGTDSAVGKRTTAIMIAEALNGRGIKATFVGTGQTAWMQGARYCVVMDAMINDFVAGGIEDAVYRAYLEERPDVIVIEGQGSVLHPAFPGSFEIIAAARPHGIVLQHAPARETFDDFPEFPMPPLERYIQVLELLSGRRVIAIALNHERMGREEIDRVAREYEARYGLPTADPLWHGTDKLVDAVIRLREQMIELGELPGPGEGARGPEVLRRDPHPRLQV